jgi:simple sugar transport system ATP-binding protein
MAEGSTQEAIRVEGIAKSYGAVKALLNVNMRLMRGEVLGLVGDNGAGKSTLIKILTGYVQPDAGSIFVNGQEVKLRSVTYARSLGIETVYQDLALASDLSVYHNMFLNRELLRPSTPLVNNREMRRLAAEHMDKMGINLPSVDTEVSKLSGGQRQAVAIARAVYSNAKILLLDEPLAAMGAREGALILDLVRNLKEMGDVSVIMISHNYLQVLEVCDRVNLLQHGAITLDKPVTPSLLDELNEAVMREYRVNKSA